MDIEQTIVSLRNDRERLDGMLKTIHRIVADDPPSITKPDSIHIREADYRHFEIRRAMIVHEDHQINHRVTVLLTTQSILFAAATFALTSSSRKANVDVHIERLIWLVSFAGITLGAVMCRAIWAGRKEQHLLKGKFSKNEKKLIDKHERTMKTESVSKSSEAAELIKYHAYLDCGETLTRCLQASSKTLAPGYTYSMALAGGSSAFWVALLILYRLHWI